MPIALTTVTASYFYPRPPRGGRLPSFPRESTLLPISIHALREEGDNPVNEDGEAVIEFLSTPSARRATSISLLALWPLLFLSTPSARRATSHFLYGSSSQQLFLSTPSARRATSGWTKWASKFSNFYPRPPRGGRHGEHRTGHHKHRRFLSTPSARRATRAAEALQ